MSQKLHVNERVDVSNFEKQSIDSEINNNKSDLSNNVEALSAGSELNILPFFPKTLIELIRVAQVFAPDRGIIYVDGKGNEDLQTYPDLLRAGGQVLAGLRAKGIKPGDKVVLQIDNDKNFTAAFWGCILGGFIAAPIALPNSFPISMSVDKVANVCGMLDNTYILTDQSSEIYEDLDIISFISIMDLLDYPEDKNYIEIDPNDLAYLQFSSGSTGDPKGVMLTHYNLIYNIFAIERSVANDEQQKIINLWYNNPPEPRDYSIATCSWLPFTHDLGLVGFHLAPMAAAMTQVKMSTTTFILNPTLNIRLIDKYRATQIASPNFGLLWMLNMVKHEDIKDVDLSCIHVLFCGGEPISGNAVRRFIDRFSKYGFNPNAFYPMYSMAEATLMVTTLSNGEETVLHLLDRDIFSKDHVAVKAKEGASIIEFIDEGYPCPGMEIRIVDDNDNILKEGAVGHIQIKGPGVSKGYYKNEKANNDLFVEGWLRTGDLGFLKNRRLAVTGRHKDIIFVNGQNFYSSDIEEELQQLPFIGFKNMAVCGITNEIDGEEKIVLFMKTNKTKEKLQDLLEKCNVELVKNIRIGLHSIVPLDDIPRTTSGKTKRFEIREKYAAGEFTEVEVNRLDQNTIPLPEAFETKEESENVLLDTETEKNILNNLDLTDLIKSLPEAITKGRHGGRWQILPFFVRTLRNMLKISIILSPHKGVLFIDEDENERTQTNTELLKSAECILGGLREKGLKPGVQVILQVDDQPLFLSAFWGSILGGFIPAPLPIPGTFPVSEGVERITGVCSILDDFCIITDQPEKKYELLGNVRIFNVNELIEHAPSKRHYKAKPDDVAFLQFSSGSTGDPKGVMLSHKNVISCIESASIGLIDTAIGDNRPVLGFGLYILKRRLFENKGPGPVNTILEKFSKSIFGRLLKMSKTGNYILDTFLILAGNKVSPNLDMTYDNLTFVNWMPYSHVMGLIGFHIGPLFGGTKRVSLSPKTFIEKPALYLKLVQRFQSSHIPCPNFAAQWMTTQIKEDEIKDLDLSCVIALMNGSEPISATIVRNFLKKFEKYGLDPRAMWMAYGMSEATVDITGTRILHDPIIHKVDKNLFFRNKIIVPTSSEDGIELVDLGEPIQCVEVRIVNDDDQLLNENMVGHIQIKGPNVAKRGYINNPKANSDLFCDGWLRSGDMGFIKKGRLVVAGRLKDIIFINGQNLYANDIEEHINSMPGMSASEFAVSGIRDYIDDTEKIVLFINSSISKKALSQLLARINNLLIKKIGIRLDFLAPVAEIPRTPSAKIRRYRLRERFENKEYENIITAEEAFDGGGEDNRDKEEALNDIEKRLLNIWLDVMDVDAISKKDNFFDLGGNSLRATKIASGVKDEFKIEMSIKSIFEYQTIEALGEAVELFIASNSVSKYPPVKPLPVEAHYALSNAQKRLWTLDKIIPESPLYNVPAAILIENMKLDLDLITCSLQSVIDRHETLRTCFATIDEVPVQVIAESLKADIIVIDISDEFEPENKLKQIIEQEKFIFFNLEQAPLFRVKIVKLSKEKHALIFVIHHIIFDGWSMGLLAREAAGNYFSFQAGKPSPFGELSVQYKDFAVWQNQLLERNFLNDQKEYWLEQLKGELPVLNLPTDRPRPSIQTQNGATYKTIIEKEHANKLLALAKKLNVTPFMMTCAIFNILIHKLTGQDDIIVGSPIAGRRISEIEPLIGFFVNMLPIRSDFSNDLKFTDFLKQIKEKSLGAFQNQDYPFDRLVELVNPNRDMGRNPLVDVVFEYRDITMNPLNNIQFGEIKAQDITGDDPMSKFDLVVRCDEVKDGFQMMVEYNADLFKGNTIERVVRWYNNLMINIIESPDDKLSNIEMLSPDEREKILKEFNATDLIFPEEKCAHTLFEEKAAIFPDRPAIIFKGEVISYNELDKRSNQLARYLKKNGIGSQDFVGILTGRCSEMILAQLAILKIGGVFVSIDPEYPIERIRYILEDSKAKLLFTKKSFQGKLPDIESHVVCIEDSIVEMLNENDGHLCENVRPEHLAYTLYTSGSTGRPKGARITHGNMSNLARWHACAFEINEKDRATQLAGVAFDAMIWEIWPYLISGSCVAPLEMRLGEVSPKDLVSWIKKNEITRTFIPTKLAEIILAADLSQLKLKSLFTGGDRLNRVAQKHSFDVFNNYGPTEATVVATSANVSDWDNSNGNPPIGKPISNTQIYILDKYQNPVPIGIEGELYIGGLSVGNGYLNDPEKTKEAFIENPFSKSDDRLYRTGDYARWLFDGNIDFIGRKDFQIEIRGYRVEIGEIEAALAGHDLIKDCVVIHKTEMKGNIQLVAFYIADDPINDDAIKAYLKNQLPAYMIPARFIQLDEFPMTQNGKLDRNVLCKMAELQIDSLEEYVAPGNEIEEALSQVWRDVLKVDKVGIHNNFFDLGGDSILGIQVVSRLNRMGYNLQTRDVLTYQTIAEVARVVDKDKIIEAEQGPVSGDAPFTPIQKWFFDQKFINENQFNQALMFSSKVRLQEKSLKNSLQAILDHHDALRTRFTDSHQENIASHDEVLFLVKDVDSEEQLMSRVEKLQSSFDIAGGQLFGAGLFHFGDIDYIVLCAHHLVVDGLSWRIILEDMINGYLASLQDHEIELPVKSASYKEWATKFNEYASSDTLLDEVAYWKNELSVSIPELRLDCNNGLNDVASQDSVYFELDKKETEALLKDAHKSYNTNVNDIMLTALMKSLHIWTGSNNVAFDLEGHGREDVIEEVDISRTVGWFTTIFPVVFQVPGDKDIAAQIKYVKEKLRDMPYKGFNYNVLKYLKNVDLNISTGISFNYLGQVLEPDEINDTFFLVKKELPGTIDSKNLRPNFIDIICIVVDGRLRVDFNYSTNKHAKESVEKLASMYRDDLLNVMAHCLDPENYDVTPSDFNLLDVDQDTLDNLSEFE